MRNLYKLFPKVNICEMDPIKCAYSADRTKLEKGCCIFRPYNGKWKNIPDFASLNIRYLLSTAENSCSNTFIVKALEGRNTIVLKRCEEFAENVKIQVSVSLETHGSPYPYAQSIILLNLSSAFGEWTVWEYPDITQYISVLEYKNRDRSYFVIKFNLTDWLPANPTDSIGKTGMETRENPPCVDCICHDFEKLFNKHSTSDIILQCGEKKIYAHTAILTARSPVFATMFRNNKDSSKNEPIVITDIDPDILDILVRFIYCGSIRNLSATTVGKLSAAADKYGIEGLQMKCWVFMVKDKLANTEVVDSNSDLTGKEADQSNFDTIKAIMETDEWKKLVQEKPMAACKVFQIMSQRD